MSKKRKSCVKFAGRVIDNLKPVRIDPEVDPPTHCCFRCWSNEHYLRDCSVFGGPYCVNCGRRGIFIDNCPRCGDAWIRLVTERNVYGGRLWCLQMENDVLQQQYNLRLSKQNDMELEQKKCRLIDVDVKKIPKEDAQYVPKDTVSNKAVAKEYVTKEYVSIEAPAREYVSIDAVSKKCVPRENVPKEDVPKEVIPKECVPNEVVPREIVNCEITKKVAPKEKLPILVPRANVPKEDVPKEVIPKEAILREEIPKECVPNVVVPREIVNCIITKNVAPKEKLPIWQEVSAGIDVLLKASSYPSLEYWTQLVDAMVNMSPKALNIFQTIIDGLSQFSYS